MHQGYHRLLFVFLLAVLGAPARAQAQSLIVSVPNTDVTRPGVSMIAHESQLNTWSQPYAYWNSFTFATQGIGHNIELAATLYGVSRPGSGNVAVALGYKHRIPLDPSSPWEPTVAVGQMFPVSLSGTGVGTWTYGVGSLRVPGLRTRVTVGPSYGTRQIFGRTTVSAIVGLEQPITHQISLIADWFSGDHDLGAAVPGVQFNVTHALIVIGGFKIPNTKRAGPPAALVELTYEF
ncbi:MAG: hypothetical protein MUF34_08810 [Polyangiaceae bacterium]|jgi:hypothetical protein|nr:hypothetical protein [Polyangiaceae bacterium]